jgi:hypothetical protein
MGDNFHYYKLQERDAIVNVYNNYLKLVGCDKLQLLPDKLRLEHFDAVVTSANTKVVIEHKNRFANASEFGGALLECKKFYYLKDLYAKHKKPVLYINEFQDFTFIFQLHPYYISNTTPSLSGLTTCPKSTAADRGYEDKPCFNVPFDNNPNLLAILRTSNYSPIGSFSDEVERIRKEDDDFIAGLLNNI